MAITVWNVEMKNYYYINIWINLAKDFLESYIQQLPISEISINTHSIVLQLIDDDVVLKYFNILNINMSNVISANIIKRYYNYLARVIKTPEIFV